MVDVTDTTVMPAYYDNTTVVYTPQIHYYCTTVEIRLFSCGQQSHLSV